MSKRFNKQRKRLFICNQGVRLVTNLFIRIGVGFVILVGLLLATGLIITKAMPDGTEQFSGVAAAAARNALQHAYGFYDNPIKRGAYIHKYKVVAVQIKGPPPKVPTPPPRDDSEPRPALEPTSGGGGLLRPMRQGRLFLFIKPECAPIPCSRHRSTLSW